MELGSLYLRVFHRNGSVFYPLKYLLHHLVGTNEATVMMPRTQMKKFCLTNNNSTRYTLRVDGQITTKHCNMTTGTYD